MYFSVLQRKYFQHLLPLQHENYIINTYFVAFLLVPTGHLENGLEQNHYSYQQCISHV